jgi:hypothetical protein
MRITLMCAKGQYVSPVASFLSGVLPNGEGLVMVLRLYADESIDDATGIFRVAGYLMTHRQWKSLDRKISNALGTLLWFHMNEGDHKKHPHIYKKLLNIITPKAVLAGFSVSVNKKEYDTLLSERSGKQPLKYWMGSSYAFLVQSAMSLCGIWCREQSLTDEWIAYFFEAGHPSQGDADAFVKLFDKKQYKAHAVQARYASHTFLAKEGPLSKALIPCDILAWHLTNWRRGGNQSKELQRLFAVNTRYKDFDSGEIRALIAKSKRRMESFDKAGRPRKHGEHESIS